MKANIAASVLSIQDNIKKPGNTLRTYNSEQQNVDSYAYCYISTNIDMNKPNNDGI